MPTAEGEARSRPRPLSPSPHVPARPYSPRSDEPPGVIASAGRPRGVVRATMATMRPRQWVKNLLVVAAPGAAGALSHDHVPVRVAFAFVAFCLLASGTYAINDVRDAAEDRRHPRKRHRPVAAGEITPRFALGIGAGLMVAGLVCCALVRPELAIVGAAYLALTLSYATVWRRIVIADIAAIAAGFVLRAVAGGVAAPVALSLWFLLVVTFSAVFVAAGKRYSELQRSGGLRAGGRGVLRYYTEARLRVAFEVSAVLALVAYLGWASADGVPLRLITVAPFAACLARYGQLLRGGAGEAPEELVLGDRWLMAFGLIWIIAFAITVHVTY